MVLAAWLEQLMIILHAIGFFILIEDTFNLIPIPKKYGVKIKGLPIEHYWGGYALLIVSLFFLLPITDYLVWLNIAFWIVSYVLTRKFAKQVIYVALILVFILIFNVVDLGQIYPTIPVLYGIIFSFIITIWIALRSQGERATIVTFS